MLSILFTLITCLSALPLPTKRDGIVYTGTASYYNPDKHPGACGVKVVRTDMAVALSAEKLEEFECGDVISVEFNGRSELVTVSDECRGCQGDSIELTQGAYDNLTSFEVWPATVEWSLYKAAGEDELE